MAVAISTLTPDIQMEIPELPGFIAQRHFLKAAREFAERSRAWRQDIQLSIVDGTATLDLALEYGADVELVDIVSIKPASGGAPLEARTPQWLDTNRTNWRTETSDPATYYFLSSNNKIRLVPIPASTVINYYDARVALKPKLTATTIPDIIANKFDELLIHGALSRIYAIPRKPWTDPNLSSYHLALFERGVLDARAEGTDEFQTGVPRTVKYGGL